MNVDAFHDWSPGSCVVRLAKDAPDFALAVENVEVGLRPGARQARDRGAAKDEGGGQAVGL
jgi:hypothetical protein